MTLDPTDARLAVTLQLDAIVRYPELARFQQRAVHDATPLPEGKQADPEVHLVAETLRLAYFTLAMQVVQGQPHGRERSIALTELETSMMYAVKGLYA